MAELFAGADDLVATWVASRVPECSDDSFKPCVTIGVESGTRIIAGFVYHDYKPEFGTIEWSAAADSPVWARKEIIKSLLQYPFEQLGVFKLFSVIPLDNRRATASIEHIGFIREAVLAHQLGRGRHAAVYRMTKPKYLTLYGGVNGKEIHAKCA